MKPMPIYRFFGGTKGGKTGNLNIRLTKVKKAQEKQLRLLHAFFRMLRPDSYILQGLILILQGLFFNPQGFLRPAGLF